MLYNLIVGTLMTIMLWLAIRGIIWQKKHPEPERGRLLFHLVMDFWFDFAVSASILALLPAVRKAVRT